MTNQYDTIVLLASQSLSEAEQARMLGSFAYELGWRPSYRLRVPKVDAFAAAHLVVEHGLENTAVITFLRSPRRYADLSFSEKKVLLSLSYNNLVDWHINVGTSEATFVYNRVSPASPASIVGEFSISRTDVDRLRSDLFDQVVGKRPNPNLPALDDALIDTISYWKRALAAEMRYEVSNQALSSLFNAIIFARAVEDHSRRLSFWHGHERPSEPGILLEMWGSMDPRLTISELFLRAIRQIVGGQNVPPYLIDEAELTPFEPLDKETISALLADFYRNKYAPYEYDFSVMSKHALSRIYEHYVSVLRVARVEESRQLTIFPRLPEEVKSKAYGSVYTPQYIARFFAKYLREQMPPVVFKRIRATDPACGSGIFLRTLLELQFESLENEITEERVGSAFTNVLGLDIDGNACRATILSLALLHLVLIDSFPDALNVEPADAIRYYQEHPELKESFDAVVANPPFVSLDVQPSSTREHVSHFMEKYAWGAPLE